ncbi:MAG: hypothetical protein UHW86_08410 [Spirochaetota bacterium]|jgi:hypothetical protein|nr:hypothetical protein [Spirochaetota bacterium]
MSNLSNVSSAKNTIRQILPLVDEAERKFKSARNWGFLDIFGGGLIVDLFKHGKLNSANNTMNEISYHLQILQNQLDSLTIPTDYRMKFGFSSFGDFLFDGAIFDIYMQSKIMSSLDQVRKLKNKLVQLHDMLDRM